MNSTQESARKVRHAVSSGLSFVQTAVKDISSNRPDLTEALRLHSFGTQKLREALLELDQLLKKDKDGHSE